LHFGILVFCVKEFFCVQRIFIFGVSVLVQGKLKGIENLDVAT
jgi:hypothetical protein